MSDYGRQDNSDRDNQNDSNLDRFSEFQNGYPDSGYSPYDSDMPNRRDQKKDSQGMATASLVLGICSILFCCCGISWVFGMIGIGLAILSRGSGVMRSLAKIGLGLSIAGSILGIITMTAFILYTFTHVSQNDTGTQFFEQYYDNLNNYDGLKNYFSDVNV